MDLEAFECPICLSLFEGSIFQCKNGHVVCEACRIRINGTCPSCRNPVGEIRCRALENAIADLVLPCAFSSHGCTQLLKHKERREHEAFHCQHAPFACPFQGCTNSVESTLLLHDHILDAHTNAINNVVSFAGSVQVVLHWNTPFQVLLDLVDRRVFLLLNGGDVRSGRSLSMVCVGPRPAANQSLEYKLEVGGNGEPGALSLSASGSVPCVRSWTGQHPSDGFLFVPDAYWTSFRCVLVNVRVRKSAVESALGSLTSSVRCFRHASQEAFVLLVLVFISLAMAIMLGCWLGRRASGTLSVPYYKTFWLF